MLAPLRPNNYLTAAGTTKGGLTQLNVAASTDLRSLDGFKRLVIREQNGALVRLEELGFEPEEVDAVRPEQHSPIAVTRPDRNSLTTTRPPPHTGLSPR